MSLINREPSPEQTSANRANSLLSTGPRTEQGIANSSRNLPKSRPFSGVVAHSMAAIGENPDELEQVHKALVEAMVPRDKWEAAWVQDIASLRWRLERLQRAEVGVLAVRKRKLAGDRKRESMPAEGADGLFLRQQGAVVGFTGLPDSPWKFQQVIKFLHQLRDLARSASFEKDGLIYFHVLYGKEPGIVGATLQGRFEGLVKRSEERKVRQGDPGQIALIGGVNQEIENYEQKQALYAAEHREDDPVRADADLLLPDQEVDTLIRYETHLEDQIERKLRQFYARRREPVLRRPETVSPANAEPVTGDLACESTAVGA